LSTQFSAKIWRKLVYEPFTHNQDLNKQPLLVIVDSIDSCFFQLIVDRYYDSSGAAVNDIGPANLGRFLSGLIERGHGPAIWPCNLKLIVTKRSVFDFPIKSSPNALIQASVQLDSSPQIRSSLVNFIRSNLKNHADTQLVDYIVSKSSSNFIYVKLIVR
jgi:hypothetical protein